MQNPEGPPMSALQQMVHRRSSSPVRPIVQQQPRRRESPLFMIPGTGPPLGPTELAGAVTPREGVVVRQPARRNYTPGGSGERLAPGAPRGPSRPTSAVGYVTAIAECAWPPEEPPEEAPSEEELRAAREARAKQEAEFQRQIVEVATSNIKGVQEPEAAEEPNVNIRYVNSFAMEALTRISAARTGTRNVLLHDIREGATDKQLLPNCLTRQIKIRGVGGLAVVIEVGILDKACKKVLGMDRLAVKFPYCDLEGKAFSEVRKRWCDERVERRFGAEMSPLKLIAAALKPGQTVKDSLKEKHWAIPLYSAFAGQPDQHLIHGGFLFTSRLLLAEPLLGDGWTLVPLGGVAQWARLPMGAREFVCGEIIKAVARLHEIGFAHYDIKSSNILLGFDGSVSIGDFGACAPIHQPRRCAEGVTLLFVDPEHASCVLEGGTLPTDAKYDSWSVGMTCYHLVTSDRLPYGIYRTTQVLEHIASLRSRSFLKRLLEPYNPEEVLIDAGASCLWAKIISELLTIPRAERPTPQQIIEKYHYWEYSTTSPG
ncbi:hypothetical protein ACSSS7_004198 [Eimeria intestinalis]